MANIIEFFVAFDTSKLRDAVALAEAGRAGEVRFLGEIENTEAAVKTMPVAYFPSCIGRLAPVLSLMTGRCISTVRLVATIDVPGHLAFQGD
jgi:hypothetical protein